MSETVADLAVSLKLKPDQASWDKGTKLIENVKNALMLYAGVAGVRKLNDLVSSTIELGGQLDDLAQKTGLTVEALQEYGFAAKMGGSDTSSFAMGLQKLSKGLVDALTGAGPAADALKQLHVTTSDVKQAMSGPQGLDSFLMKVAEQFSKMSDGPAKTALALALFGKAGAELIPTLNQGKDGLAALRKEANDLGGVLGKKDISNLDTLGDNIDKAKLAFAGLKNQAVMALVPVLQKMAAGLVNWVKSNKEAIQTTLKFVVSGLATILEVTGHVFSALGAVVGWLSKHGRVANAILIAIGVTLTALTISAAAAWLAMAAPVLLFIAVLASVILVFEDLWDSIMTGQGVFASIFRVMKSGLTLFVSEIKRHFQSIKQFFVDIGSAIKSTFYGAINWIEQQIDNVIKKVIAAGQWVKSLPGKAWDMINGSIDFTSAFNMPAVAGAPNKSITNGGVTINNNVVSNSADPVQVAKETTKQFRSEWEAKMRETNSDMGGD